MPSTSRICQRGFTINGIAAVVAWTLCSLARSICADDGLEFFEKRIRPILVARCESCHSQAKGKTSGGLALDTRNGWEKGGDSGSPILPGRPNASLLIQAVNYVEGGPQMPPEEEGGQLTDSEIAAFTEWVRRGAPDPRHAEPRIGGMTAQEARRWWSFLPVRRIKPPSASHSKWPRNEIDHFVLAGLADGSNSPSPITTQRVASAEQPRGDSPDLGSSHAVAAPHRHSANQTPVMQPSPAAGRRTLIRRMTFDLTGLPPTPQEVDSFIQDDSHDAVERLVDRLLASPRYGQRWARHWLDIVRYADYYDADAKARQLTAEPLDAWRYRDWVVGAFNEDLPFDQLIIHQIAGDRLPDPHGSEVYPDGLIATTFLSNGVWDPHDADKEKIVSDMADDNIDTIGKAFLGLTLGCARCHDHKFDPISTEDYYGLAGIFYSSHFLEKLGTKGGAYTMHRVPLVPAAVIRKREQQLKNLNEVKSQLKALDGQTPSPPANDARRVQLVRQRDLLIRDLVPEPPRAMAVLEGGTPGGLFPGIQDVPIHIRGSYAQLGDVVPRRLPRFFAGAHQPSIGSGSGRMELARWVASEDNPLTARVIVNRVWQWHFGEGLVRTPNNFGKLGAAPTHPELLDWLATEFVDARWSLKQLHRRILLSATYRQSSHGSRPNTELDPENRRLSRFSSRRLAAEEIRDAILFVADQLESAAGGPAGQDFTIRRRSLYVQTARWNRSSFANLFDAANPDASTEKRITSTIAPQALLLLNHPFVWKQAEFLADRLVRAVPDGGDDRIDSAYRLVFARPATEEEMHIARELVNSAGNSAWFELAHVLLCSNEFVYLD